VVTATLEDPQAACPTDSKVVTSFETPPFLICVAIIHHLAPTSHVWTTTFKVLAAAALSKVEDILPESAIAVSNNDRFSCGGGRCGWTFLDFLLWQRKVIQVSDFGDPCPIPIVLEHHLMRNCACNDFSPWGKYFRLMVKTQQD
jgi:hypothetical protein